MATNYEVFQTDIDVSLKGIKETLDNLKRLQSNLKGMGGFAEGLSKDFKNIENTLKQFSTFNKTIFGEEFSKYINNVSSDLDQLNAVIDSLFKTLPRKAEPAVTILRKQFATLRSEAASTEAILSSLTKYDIQIANLQKALAAPGLPPQATADLGKQLDEAEDKRNAILNQLKEEGKTVKDVEETYQKQLKSLQELAEQVKTLEQEQILVANAQKEQTQALKDTIKEQEKLLKLKEQEAESQKKIALEEERFKLIEARRAALRSQGAIGITRGIQPTLGAVGDILKRGPITGFQDIAQRGQEILAATNDLRKNFHDITAAVNLFGAEGGNAFVALRRAIYGTTEPTDQFGKVLNQVIKYTVSFSRTTNQLQSEAASLAETLARSNIQLRAQGGSLRNLGKEEGVAATEFAQLNTQITNSVNEFQKLQSAIQRGATGKKFGLDIAAYIRGVQNLNLQFDDLEENLKTVYKLDPVSSTTLQHLQQMRGAVSENERLLQEITVNLKAVDQGGTVWDKLKRGVNNLLVPLRGVKKEINEGQTGAFQLADSFDKAAKSASFLGDVLKQAIGTAVGIPLSGIVQQLTDFLTLPIRIPVNLVLAPFRLLSDIVGTLTNQFTQFFASIPQEFKQVNIQVQDFTTTLTQMLAGFDKDTVRKSVQGAMDYIADIIAKTPFELPTGQAAFQQLVTAGFDPKQWLKPAADAAAAMNKDMNQLIFAMQRLKAGSKGMGVEMLRDFGIPVQQVGVWLDQSTGKMVEANKVLGKSKEDLQAAGYAWKQWRFDAAGSLEQTPIEALEILNGYLQQNAIFADASTARSRTLSGAISNLNDAFNKLYMQLGQPVFKAFTDIVLNVQDVLNQVIDTIRPFTTLIGEELAGSISSIWEAITGIKQGVDEMGRPFEEAATRTKEIANAIVNFLKPALFTILAIVKGDWPKAWGILLKAAQDAVKKIGEWLKGSGREWFQWGIGLVKQLAQGLIAGTKTLIRGAITLVGQTVAGFLKPGSPPKEGPLSDIDKWGQGLMGAFTSGFRLADIDFLRTIGDTIKGSLSNMGLDQFKNVRQTIIEIIGGINQTGQINEDLWQQVQANLGASNTELTEFVRLNLELKKVTKEYQDAEKAGFIPKELQDRLEAAQLAVQLKEEELKLQDQINQQQTAGADGTGVSPDDLKKQLQNELEMLKKKKKIGLISEKEYLDAVQGLRKQYAEQFLIAGDENAAKNQVNLAKETDKELFKQDKEFLEKKRKLGLVTEAEYLQQLQDLNKQEAERLLMAGDEEAAKAKIAAAQDLQKRIEKEQLAEQKKALDKQIEQERQILELKYKKGLITEQEYREGLVKLQEGYIDQLLQLGFPVDKEIDKLKSLQSELKALTDIKLDQPQDILVSFGEGVSNELQAMMDEIKTQFSTIGTSTWEEFSKTFHDAFDGLWQDIFSPEAGPITSINQLFEWISQSFLSWSQGEGQVTFQTVGTVIGESLVNGVKTALGLNTGVSTVINEFSAGIGSSTGTIFATFNNLAANAIAGFIQGLTGGELIGKDLANRIGKGLTDGLLPLGNTTVQSIIATIGQGIANTDWLFLISPISKAFQWLYDWLVGKSLIPDLINEIVRLFTTIPTSLTETDFFGSMVGVFESMYDTMVEAGSNLVQGLINGMTTAKESLVATAETLAQEVGSYWPFSPAEKGPLSQEPNWFNYLIPGLQLAISAVNPLLGSLTNMVVNTASGVANVWSQMTSNTTTAMNASVQVVNTASDIITRKMQETAQSVSKSVQSINDSISHSRLSEDLGSGFGNYGHNGGNGPNIHEQGGIAASWIRFFQNLRQQGTISTYGKSYQTGTAYVPQTGSAIIHRGEMVVPARMAEAIRMQLNNPNMNVQKSSTKQYTFEAGAFAGAFPNVTKAKDASNIIKQIEQMVLRGEMRATVV